MEKQIILKLYFKSIGAAILASLLGIAVYALLGGLMNLGLGFAIAAYFIFSFISLKRSVAKGEVVSVYGQCYEVLDKSKFTANKLRPHRFIVSNIDEDAANDDADISVYIDAEIGTFLIGGMYCLLFRPYGTNEYSSRTLLSYDKVNPDVSAFEVKETSPSIGKTVQFPTKEG